jgi:hypothetical protein
MYTGMHTGYANLYPYTCTEFLVLPKEISAEIRGSVILSTGVSIFFLFKFKGPFDVAG